MSVAKATTTLVSNPGDGAAASRGDQGAALQRRSPGGPRSSSRPHHLRLGERCGPSAAPRPLARRTLSATPPEILPNVDGRRAEQLVARELEPGARASRVTSSSIAESPSQDMRVRGLAAWYA